MKRTCKTFATLKALKYLIKDKEYSCFGDVPKQRWNRLVSVTTLFPRISFQDNPRRFIVYVRTSDYVTEGVFSSSHLLLKALVTTDLFESKIISIKYEEMDNVIIGTQNKNRRIVVFRIQGVNDYLKNVLKK
jgi:hypothetical protein